MYAPCDDSAALTTWPLRARVAHARPDPPGDQRAGPDHGRHAGPRPRPHRPRRAPSPREPRGRRPDRRARAGPRRPRSRPSRPGSFVLSDAGHQALESDYDHLATEALRFLAGGRRRAPCAGFAETPRRRAREPVCRAARRRGHRHRRPRRRPRRRADRATGSPPRPARSASRAPRARSPAYSCARGTAPSSTPLGNFPQFCDAETDAFSRLLGVHVQRLATLAHGDHVCTTFVPTSRGRHAAMTHAANTTPRLDLPTPTPQKGPRDEHPHRRAATPV